MLVPFLSVLANLGIVYVGLAGGSVLLCYGLYNKSAGWVGMVSLTVLACMINYRYGINDVGETIAFFNSVYDPFYNIGASGNMTNYPGLSRCFKGNDCSVLSFQYHAAWAATFHHRFTGAAGAAFNCARLYAHIWMNTTAFALCLVQFHQPTRRKYLWLHRKMGWATITLVTSGTVTALWLGLEHGKEEFYGGYYAVAGWVSMATTLFSTLIPGVLAVVKKPADVPAHKKWMTRFYGSMWGAFLIFRVWFLFGGLFRWHKIAIIQIAVWTSAPLGVLCAEFARVRQIAAEETTSKQE